MNAHSPVAARGGPRIQVVTAASGVQAWLVEDHSQPLLAVDFAFQTGTAHDPEGRSGAAHLISGLLDEGAGDMDAEAFQAALADHAIELSFSADRDDFRGSLRTLSRFKETAFRLLGLALQKPRFDDDAVRRVKAQVVAGLRRELQDPDAICGRALSREAFGGHPYAHPTRGEIETVAAATVEDLKGMAARLFARDGLKVVAVGDITAGELAAMLDATFGPLPASAPRPAVPATVPGRLGEVHVIPMDVPQTSIRYAAPGLMRHDPDYIAAEVVNHILGGSAFTSRYFMEVREKRGLAYGVSSSLIARRAAAMHAGGTATKNDRVAESLEVMRAEMASLAAHGPSEEELKGALDYLVGSFPLRFDASSKIASQLLAFWLADLGVDYVLERNGLFRAVTLADARRAAERLYGDGRLFVVAVGQPAGLS